MSVFSRYGRMAVLQNPIVHTCQSIVMRSHIIRIGDSANGAQTTGATIHVTEDYCMKALGASCCLDEWAQMGLFT